MSNLRRSGKYSGRVGRGEGFGERLPEWHADAACAEVTVQDRSMGAAWLDLEHPKKEQAKEICEDCPVRMLCLQDAMEDLHAEGVRAGIEFEEGQVTKFEALKVRKWFGLLVPRERVFGARGGISNAAL